MCNNFSVEQKTGLPDKLILFLEKRAPGVQTNQCGLRGGEWRGEKEPNIFLNNSCLDLVFFLRYDVMILLPKLLYSVLYFL